MRITIVTGPFLSVPPAPCGAVERVWFDLAKEMARHGHNVTIICRAHPDLPRDGVRDGVRYRQIIPCSSTRRIAINLFKDFFYALRAITVLPKADILVTNTFWLPVLAPRLRPGAGRVHAHIQRVPKGQMKLYCRSGIARLAAVSTAIRNFIVEEYPAAEPLVRVFANPIDTAVFVPPPTPRVYTGEQILLYTGRIHPEKGLPLMLDGYRVFRERHPDSLVRVKLVGPWKVEDGGGGDAYLQELKDRVKGLPVEFHGPIYGRADLARELQQAHFYSYPSQAERGEASPVAPLEAMATGLVPVVSNLPQFGDYLKDGETGVVFNHRDTDATARFADALERVAFASEADLRAWSDRAARQGARFSIKDVADRYLDDFRELTHRP